MMHSHYPHHHLHQLPHHHMHPISHHHHHNHHHKHHLKHRVLGAVEPLVQYGMHEAKHTSYQHALREVTAITYLMGMGYDPSEARRMVESWEINEAFYPGQRS